MRIWKWLAAWLLILGSAIANGAFREAILLPRWGRTEALVASGLLLCSCILVVAIALARWLELGDSARCLTVGALWLGLTLVFEFGFGGLVQGHSWAEMLAAYRFEDGNLWPLVLVVTVFAPLVAARVRSRGRDGLPRAARRYEGGER